MSFLCQVGVTVKNVQGKDQNGFARCLQTGFAHQYLNGPETNTQDVTKPAFFTQQLNRPALIVHHKLGTDRIFLRENGTYRLLLWREKCTDRNNSVISEHTG